MNPNPATFNDLPTWLSNLMGAYDTAHWQTQVCEIKGGIGVLERGTFSRRAAALTSENSFRSPQEPKPRATACFSIPRSTRGKASATAASPAASPRRAAFAVRRSSCRRASADLIAVALRGRGIFVGGPITVPPAAATAEAPAEAK